MTMKLTILTQAMVMLVFVTGPASASNLLELQSTKKEEVILSIGSAPEKKKKPLELGSLRTGDAQLPGGLLSRSERMSLRARLALKRQEEVSQASRAREVQQRPVEQGQNENSSVSSQEPSDQVIYGNDNQPVLQ